MQIQLKETAKCLALGLAVLGLAATAYAVDGVIEINQARATAGGVTSGDSAGFPVTLSHGGGYRLTGNLTVGTGDATAIEVTDADVSIDLNGFTISCSSRPGACAAGSGIGINANQSNLTVINGTVRGMGQDGIVAGAQARIERVQALNNSHSGIVTGSGSSLIGNTASNNAYDGLGSGIGSTITGNTTRNNTRCGIETSTACTIAGNTTSDNGVCGVYCNGGCTISGNTVFNNKGSGISLLGGNAIIGNTVHNNDGFGLVAIGSDSGYTHNVFTGNKDGGNTPQVSGGTSLGANFCGTDTTCP